MRIFSTALLLVHAMAVFRLARGAAVDRNENRREPTFIINLMDTTKDKRIEGESGNSVATTVEYDQEGEEEEYYDEYYYDEEDGMSGDNELDFPQVAMSSKPKDPTSVLEAENTEKKQKIKKKGRGKGMKRNPCLKKYKDFCIHGTCQYLKDIRAPSCVCHTDFSGERCQFFTLPTQSKEGYNRTTALAVIAVVLSSLCLTIIGLLLMLRFHKRGAYDVESEEKVKLGLPSNH